MKLFDVVVVATWNYFIVVVIIVVILTIIGKEYGEIVLLSAKSLCKALESPWVIWLLLGFLFCFLFFCDIFWLWLAWNLWGFPWLCLLSARITGLCHHVFCLVLPRSSMRYYFLCLFKLLVPPSSPWLLATSFQSVSGHVASPFLSVSSIRTLVVLQCHRI